MTTYAELLAQATAHLREGSTTLRGDRFWTADEALDAIGDFHGLLDAIASHGRRLLRPAQLGRLGLTRHRDGLPPVERASIDLITRLETVTGEARPHPSQVGHGTTPWARSALALRAAADLVGTHFSIDGRPRSPDAAAATTATFDAGLIDLGHFAVAALAHEDPLALRAIQAGSPRGTVAKQLPGLESLADAARELSTQGAGRPATLLDSLGQTQIRVRTDDPATELSDRMVRLRQGVWSLIADHTDVLPSLRLTAGLGVAVHAHAAVFHGADLAAPDASTPTGPGVLVAHGRSWQRLHQALSQFAVLVPPIASVRDDAVAAARLLGELVPLDAPRGHVPAAADRHVGAVLNGAVQVMADIAVHEGAAFDRISRSGLLHIPARALPRGLVTDHPDVAAARLGGRTVPAPAELLQALAGMYTEVAAHPIGVPTLQPPDPRVARSPVVPMPAV
ncbi:hypothetical protein [Cellulomonas sp. C5510]|uniref:hypothetical protein n=1 Tax=Cellulomonas sp. C5510 TaxID=2871170 RepID=UPI001C94A370|nr:hypothetical protein [Cellulomonas sp. C5510]QZN84931.1 hypothetical protein K5O09_14125 [Cellulomonas sp. C5510]